MKNIGKVVGRGFVVFFGGTFIATLLLTLAYMLPVDEEHQASSYKMLRDEGMYNRALVSGERYENHYYNVLMPDGLDNATDGVMLYIAMDTNSGNPLVRAMDSYSETGRGSYSYYWHGYVAVLRPLMLLFDYQEFRVANCALQLLLVFLLAFLIGRAKGMRYVLMFLTSYILLMPIAMPLSLQFSWIFYVSYVGLLVLLWKRDSFLKKSRYIYFFLVMGMAACYFDLLTYPLFTWGVPLVWWIVMDSTERKEGDWVRQVIASGISWIAGYAGMWIMKWTLATVILGRNIFESAINEVFLRSGMQGDGNIPSLRYVENGSLGERFQAIYFNWRHYQYKVYAWILAIWLIWWICASLSRGWHRDERRRAYLLIGFSSAVWCFVLSNHTRGHHYFTYRTFGVSVLAFLAILLGSTSYVKKKVIVSLKNRFLVCGSLVIAFLLSLPLTLLVPFEELLVINGSEQFRQLPMENNDLLEVEFTPTFDNIIEFGLGLQSAGKVGLCEVTLWEREQQLYQETFLVETFGDGNYHIKDTTWELVHGNTYRLTIEVKDTEEPILVWVTDNGTMPLTEYGELSVNGTTESGQLLTSIKYWRRPSLNGTLMFFSMTWTGILMSAGYALWPKGKKTNSFFLQ